jgi:HTH-type transcriptional regulator / antitoxin HipB
MLSSNHRSARTPLQLGQLIRRERKSRGLSQAALAELVGLRQATISSLEAGEPGTRIGTLLDVIGALGWHLTVAPRVDPAAPDLDEIF